MPTPPDSTTDDTYDPLPDFKRMFSGEGPEVKLAVLKTWLAREWEEVKAGRTPVDRCLHLALLEYAVSAFEALAKVSHDRLLEAREAAKVSAKWQCVGGWIAAGLFAAAIAQVAVGVYSARHPPVIPAPVAQFMPGAVQVAAPPPAQVTVNPTFSPTIYVTAKPAPKESK